MVAPAWDGMTATQEYLALSGWARLSLACLPRHQKACLSCCWATLELLTLPGFSFPLLTLVAREGPRVVRVQPSYELEQAALAAAVGADDGQLVSGHLVGCERAKA